MRREVIACIQAEVQRYSVSISAVSSAVLYHIVCWTSRQTEREGCARVSGPEDLEEIEGVVDPGREIHRGVQPCQFLASPLSVHLHTVPRGYPRTGVDLPYKTPSISVPVQQPLLAGGGGNIPVGSGETLPFCGDNLPINTLSKVDLPSPDFPVNRILSPLLTHKLTSLSTGLSA